MTFFQKQKIYFQIHLDRAKRFLTKVKRIVWNKHILLFWYRLWIRKDESHISLSYDPDAMRVMNKKELEVYQKDIGRRRDIACKKDLNESIRGMQHQMRDYAHVHKPSHSSIEGDGSV